MHTTHPASLYARRRAAFAAQLLPGSVALIPTAPQCYRNRDNEYPYRPDSYFFYLTGFAEPHAWLLVQACGKTTLFCQPRDVAREVWEGYRLGPTAAREALGVDEAFAVQELDAQMEEVLQNRTTLYYPFGVHAGLESRVRGWFEGVRAKSRAGVICPTQQHDACALLDEMRLIKEAGEIDTLRKAGRISAAAHVGLMQQCAHRMRRGEPTREYHLEAELLHGFRLQGAQSVAYPSIVAGGANACVLHYRADYGAIASGELVLVDAGCELDNYASDLTRTFAANGKFTAPQRQLYDVVQAAQEAAIGVCRAGARFAQMHEAAVRVLAQGMLDSGLLDRDKVGGLEDVIASKAYSAFYMHRTGHWLGMDVHDCGSYVEPASPLRSDVQRGTGAPAQDVPQAPSRLLRAGMVLTIEPGIYVRPAANVPEKFWNIGIRIEDTAVVCEEGCELLTREVPVQASEIERLMSR